MMRVRFNRQLLGPAATICEELAAKFGPKPKAERASDNDSDHRRNWTTLEAAQDAARSKVAGLFASQEAKGLERYGKPLDIHDGRAWVAESREEIADAMVYITAEMRLLEQRKRVSEDARAKFLELSKIRGDIAKALVRLYMLEAT